MKTLTYGYVDYLDSVIITGWCDNPYYDPIFPPPSTIPESEVELPPVLQGIYGNWETAIESGFLSFYSYNSSTKTLEQVPINFWYSNTSTVGTEDLDDPNNILYSYLPGGRVYANVSPDSHQFFSLAYPAQQVDQPLTWESASYSGKSVIAAMLIYLAAYTAVNQPVPDSLTQIYLRAAFPQEYYDTPQEAINVYRLGPDGVALTLGESWPPEFPS